VTPLSTRIVIDTDPGIDDVVALALAARSPELDLVAVTTTYGNAGLADTTRNARHVLALAGRPDVPVLPGADRPLVRPPPGPSQKHGDRGVGYAEVERADGPAVVGSPTALLDALLPCPPDRSTVLLTLGPLTNLAQALQRDPEAIRARVRRHLTILEPPNRSTAQPPVPPDFNSATDPEAVDAVMAAGLPTEVVPPHVTRRLLVPAEAVERLAGAGDGLVRWLTDALRWYLEVHHRLHGIRGCWIHDVVAVAEAVRPGMLAFALPGPEIGARVASGVQAGLALSLLDRVFGSGWIHTPPGET
jgi:inosine-uridine nucleoside N-ribohydrolase